MLLKRSHGQSNTMIYKAWIHIKRKHRRTPCICAKNEWANHFVYFENDMKSTYFPGAQLVRIDESKFYCKDNVIWKSKEVK